MGQPAGVKLNHELGQSIGRLLLYLMDCWTVVTSGLLGWLGGVLCAVSLTGLLGATVMAALLSDLASFMSLHIFYFYTVSARFYAILLNVLSSLCKLFAGTIHKV